MNYSSLLVFVALLAGCNLVFDIDGNPYQGPGDPTDMPKDQPVDTTPDINPDDMTTPDMPKDMTLPDMPKDMDEDAPDLPPVLAPKLMITEIMINTSPVRQGELGEYIEVKNVSDTVSADPRKISFLISNEQGRPTPISVPQPSNPAELEMYNNLKSIPPGGYFVFVRYLVDELPLETLVGSGNYFDYGTYGAAAAFANSGERRVELQYFHEQTFISSDSVRWVNNQLRASDPEIDSTATLAITEDVALSVRPVFEAPHLNDTADKWCAESLRVAGPGSFFGSPGGPAKCAD